MVIFQLYTDPRYYLEDLPRAMTDRQTARESQGNLWCQHVLMIMISLIMEKKHVFTNPST